MRILKAISSWTNGVAVYLIILVVVSISVYSAYIYLSDGIVFGLVDANTRLNTARRFLDSLTPGFGQFGGIWPPFPHILMIPFVASDFLWRTGIAAWIVSGTAYVLSAYFTFRTIELITKSRLSAFFGALAIAVNINLIFLQTSAMSEAFFIMCSSGLLYGIAKYIYTKSHLFLFYAAIFAFLGSLTRFEGYALVGGSIILLILLFIFTRNTRHKSEGALILYSLPASMGMILWSLYVWTIFGDPLYWLHYYGAIAADTSQSTVSEVTKPSYIQASGTYIVSIIHMCGLVTVFLGLIGVLYLFVSRENRKYSLLLFLPVAIFLFMIATLTRNTVIIQPPITIESLLDKSLDTAREFNIRYGLSLLPYLIVFAFLITKKSKIFLFIITLLFVVQTIAYFYTPLNLTYQLGKNRTYSITQEAEWMRANYDEGLILISAQKNDRLMLEFGLPYKKYIYEGTQKYWKTSLKTPETYASWIVMRSIPGDKDSVAKALEGKKSLDNYDLVYDSGDFHIYKISKE